MGKPSDQRLRVCVAQEAARIILDEGINDYQLAKHKALERIGVHDRGALPRNIEIEQAIREHRQLFFTEADYRHQSKLWHAALAAMERLRNFRPRLVGSLLEGTAGRHSHVNLHVYSDAVEEILFVLLDLGIAYRSVERRINFGSEVRCYPGLQFMEADIEVLAVVFSHKENRQPPLSAIDGKPMRRAEITEVQKQVDQLRGDSR